MKRKCFFLLLSTLFFFMLIACSHQEVKTLNVSGRGTVTFIPDMVKLSVQVRNLNPRLEDSLIQTKETISNLLLLCKKYEVSEVDIKSSYLSTNKEYRWNQNRQEFEGYSATQKTEILFRQLSQFEAFSSELLKLRIFSINSMQFDHSQRGKYEAEANLVALDHAKENAKKMAEKMGVRLKEIIYIADSDYSQDSNSNYGARAYAKSMDVGFEVSPGILSVSREVVVKYRIK